MATSATGEIRSTPEAAPAVDFASRLMLGNFFLFCLWWGVLLMGDPFGIRTMALLKPLSMLLFLGGVVQFIAGLNKIFSGRRAGWLAVLTAPVFLLAGALPYLPESEESSDSCLLEDFHADVADAGTPLQSLLEQRFAA